MEINKQRNGQYTMRFIFSLPLEKRFIYNGGKQKEMGSSQWRNVYIQTLRNRFMFSLPLEKRFTYNGGKQTEKWAVHNEVYLQSSIFIYNGGKQTEKWAVHNEVYIQSSIGETFYI